MSPFSASRYRAPREDGQALVVPCGDAIRELLNANRKQVANYDYDLQGRSLAELAQSARQSVVAQAVTFTSAYRDVPNQWRDPQFIHTQPLFVAGHQPELVHPGVWFKNFVLGRLAHRHEGVALQLVIDSDLCRSAAIRVPAGSIEAPRAEAAAYDTQLAEQPYEERRVDDLTLAASFAERVKSTIRPFVTKPLVAELWPHVMESLRGDGNLGQALARGRHQMEAAWGNHTLELSASQVCELPEFRWFLCHVLANLPRFRQAYNGALEEYRRENHVRNRAQPVPSLADAAGWCEAPFWVWTSENPVRRALWVERIGNVLKLTDRDQMAFELEVSEAGDAARGVEQLAEIAKRGIKIRTRALVTTLFTRLLLGDLFLHGIGGAKYDQVTDELARRFFGFTPPGYLTLSATFRLPIAHESVSREQLREMAVTLREMEFHPENFLSPGATGFASEIAGSPNTLAKPVAPDKIIADKRHWIAVPKSPDNAAERHKAIVAANAALQAWIVPQRHELLARQENLARQLRASAILESREYAFCLFPESDLQPPLLDLAGREV